MNSKQEKIIARVGTQVMLTGEQLWDVFMSANFVRNKNFVADKDKVLGWLSGVDVICLVVSHEYYMALQKAIEDTFQSLCDSLSKIGITSEQACRAMIDLAEKLSENRNG